MTIRAGWTGGGIAAAAMAAVLVATPALASTAPAPDQTTLQVVTSAVPDTSPTTGWDEQAYDCTDTDPNAPFLTPNADFETGPGVRPVLGRGSHVMRTTQFNGDTELFRTAKYDGTFASDIAHLTYSTYTAAQSGNAIKQPAYLRLSFDTDGDNAPDTSLYYEPAINHPTAADTQNTWESWDTTASGELWSTDGSSDPGSLTTLQDWAAQPANADARIENTSGGSGGGVSFIAGCGGQSQTNGLFAVDSFGFETTADHVDTHDPVRPTPAAVSTLVDFDPTAVATNNLGTVVVDPASPHGWNASSYDYNTDQFTTPNQAFVFGPGTPPSGYGSRKLREGGSDIVELWRTTAQDDVNVGDIRQLSYSTYVQPDQGNTTPQQPPTLRLSVDLDGDGFADTSLYYEPSVNHPTGIVPDQWQNWDTVGANELWSIGGGQNPSDLTTLAGFASNHPQATLHESADTAGHGGLSLFVGSAGANQMNSNFYVDTVHLDFFKGTGADTAETYDFEPTVPNPTISTPHKVVGTSDITVQGTAVPNSTVELFRKSFGQADFSSAGTTQADDNGDYSFPDTVSKQTSYYVTDDGQQSNTVTTKVAIKVDLTLRSTHPGRLHMKATTDPHAGGQTVRFYRQLHNGSRVLLATVTAGPGGRASANVDAPSGHNVTVFATVTAPPGNLKGKSPSETIRIA